MANDQVTDVFCVIQDPQTKLIAAIARIGHLGLPGGKLELGEYLLDGVMRHAANEGWDIELHDEHFQVLQQSSINHKKIYWLALSVKSVAPKIQATEKGRSHPLWVQAEDLARHGHGNEFLLKYAPQGE